MPCQHGQSGRQHYETSDHHDSTIYCIDRVICNSVSFRATFLPPVFIHTSNSHPDISERSDEMPGMWMDYKRG